MRMRGQIYLGQVFELEICQGLFDSARGCFWNRDVDILVTQRDVDELVAKPCVVENGHDENGEKKINDGYIFTNFGNHGKRDNSEQQRDPWAKSNGGSEDEQGVVFNPP